MWAAKAKHVKTHQILIRLPCILPAPNVMFPFFSYLCAQLFRKKADILNMEKESQVIFDRNTVEFVTVAAEFCAFLERAEGMERGKFVDTTLKILSLLYLKAATLPEVEALGEEAPETYVTEETYEILRINLSSVLAEKDDYLEVFLSEMAYSDTPIKRTVSEDLADIYQDIKDFIFVFRLGLNETMNDALYTCKENFGLYWGQKLVNTMRALHNIKYNPDNEPEEENCHCHEGECQCSAITE